MSNREPDPKLKIEVLDKNIHDRRTFSCGVPALDNYLLRQAAQDMEKHAAVVYVAVHGASTIAGYYTLSQFGINRRPLTCQNQAWASFGTVSPPNLVVMQNHCRHGQFRSL